MAQLVSSKGKSPMWGTHVVLHIEKLMTDEWKQTVIYRQFCSPNRIPTREKKRQNENRRQRIRELDNVTNAMSMNVDGLRKLVEDRVSRCAAVHGVMKSRT